MITVQPFSTRASATPKPMPVLDQHDDFKHLIESIDIPDVPPIISIFAFLSFCVYFTWSAIVNRFLVR